MKQLSRFLCKPLIMFALGLFTVAFATAQEQRNRASGPLTPAIGIKGGVNFANLYVDEPHDGSLKTGLNLGLFAKLPITRGFSIQPEVLYSSKGSKINLNNPLTGGDYRFNLNYVEVPVLAVINLARNFNIHAGPYVSYLTSANIKTAGDGPGNDEVLGFNEDDFNRVDYGVTGGIGIDISKITIGARYSYGLREVGKSSEIITTALSDSKNSVISLYIGFGF